MGVVILTLVTFGLWLYFPVAELAVEQIRSHQSSNHLRARPRLSASRSVKRNTQLVARADNNATMTGAGQ